MNAGPRTIRVVTTDSNQMACHLLSDALSKENGISVVASAADSESFMRSLQTAKPDIALISAALPGGPMRRGLDSQSPSNQPISCPWVLLLDETEPHMVVAAFRAGARGVFARTQSDVRLLAKCIRRVVEGQVWVDSHVNGQ